MLTAQFNKKLVKKYLQAVLLWWCQFRKAKNGSTMVHEK